jgi:hypothetical protein
MPDQAGLALGAARRGSGRRSGRRLRMLTAMRSLAGAVREFASRGGGVEARRGCAGCSWLRGRVHPSQVDVVAAPGLRGGDAVPCTVPRNAECSDKQGNRRGRETGHRNEHSDGGGGNHIPRFI